MVTNARKSFFNHIKSSYDIEEEDLDGGAIVSTLNALNHHILILIIRLMKNAKSANGTNSNFLLCNYVLLMKVKRFFINVYGAVIPLS